MSSFHLFSIDKFLRDWLAGTHTPQVWRVHSFDRSVHSWLHVKISQQTLWRKEIPHHKSAFSGVLLETRMILRKKGGKEEEQKERRRKKNRRKEVKRKKKKKRLWFGLIRPSQFCHVASPLWHLTAALHHPHSSFIFFFPCEITQERFSLFFFLFYSRLLSFLSLFSLYLFSPHFHKWMDPQEE
jgi:hypothetical protein